MVEQGEFLGSRGHFRFVVVRSLLDSRKFSSKTTKIKKMSVDGC